MTADPPLDCARCGKTLQPSYHFCPECGLPARGGGVLSSQIGELRQELATPHREGRRPWRRLLVPTASAVMTALVLAVGLLLFNRPLIEMLFPPADEAVAAPLAIAPRWEPRWVALPAGSFHSGPPFEISEADLSIWDTPERNIEQHVITNGEWLRFLTEDEEHLRELGIWEDAIPRFASGWRRDRVTGRPLLPREPGTGRELADELVTDVMIEEIVHYRRWVTGSADYRIEKMGITNERWLAFLVAEESRLREEGVWESVLPGPGSGWRRRGDGLPALPHGPRVDIRARPLDVVSAVLFDALARLPPLAATSPDARDDALRVFVVRSALAAQGALGEVARVDDFEDAGSLVHGVDVEAVRRFHEWASRWEIPRGFEISKYEIRNVLWREFLEAEEASLREKGLWTEAMPGEAGGWELDEEGRYTPPVSELDMPVRHVSARAVRAFGDYLTRRLGEPGVEIRMPTPIEWEYAARAGTWNVYPWGNTFEGDPELYTGDAKTRRGIADNSPLPVDYVDEDESPFGVVALGVNVAEWVEDFWEEDLDEDGEIDRMRERRYLRTEIRGACFAMGAAEARYRARVWVELWRWEDPRNQYAYTGVRLVKVRTGE